MTTPQSFVEKYVLGQQVDRVENSSLFLANGVELELFESAQDCCARANGVWRKFDEGEAGITAVKIEENTVKDEWGRSETEALITLLHGNDRIAQATCVADDGNGGYYFSVLSLKVKLPDGRTDEAEIVQS